MDLENVVIELIVKAGETKSLAMEALKRAREGDFAQSEQSMAASREAAKQAHKIQTALIAADEGQGKVPVSLVLVHAQDHLMNAMLAQDLVEEMVYLYQRLEK